jgi:hypothetical protein
MNEKEKNRVSADEKRLTKIERDAIRAKCRRQYRTVDESVERGEDAPKRYGNWAGPTIERLLDCCDALEVELQQAREATAPDGGLEAQLKEVTCSNILIASGDLFDDGPFQFVYLDEVRKLLARVRQESALAALANAAALMEKMMGGVLTAEPSGVNVPNVFANAIRALPVKGTSLAEHDAALVAGAYQAAAMLLTGVLREKGKRTGTSLIARYEAVDRIQALTPADAQRWVAEFERKVRLEEAERAPHGDDCLMRNWDGTTTGLDCSCRRGKRIAALRPPSPAGEPQGSKT